VDNLTQDVILSTEFFKCTGVLIDYKRKRLSLYNESINMPLLTAIDPTRVVCTSHKIRIPPKHEALIPIKLTSKMGFDSGITKALPQTSRRGLSIASTLIRCITTSSMCQIMNPMSKMAGHAFAYLNPFEVNTVGVKLIDMMDCINVKLCRTRKLNCLGEHATPDAGTRDGQNLTCPIIATD